MSDCAERVPDDLNRTALRRLEAKLQEGIDSGPSEEMTAEDWAEMRQALMDSHQQQKYR
jgi:hypothetical protein